MFVDKLWNIMESDVFTFKTTDLLFNQYNSVNIEYDKNDADNIRRANLKYYLESFTKQPEVLVVGEAPGKKGCRFSGVPFTSEDLLVNGELGFTGSQSNISKNLACEATASVFWNCMKQHHPSFFAWNAVPFHPHKGDLGLSNRTPNNEELKEHSNILKKVIGAIEPETIIALGRTSEKLLTKLGYKCLYVRHPSYGGAKLFVDGMKLYINY